MRSFSPLLLALLTVTVLMGCKRAPKLEDRRRCLQSHGCKHEGKCSGRDGKCVAASDADCEMHEGVCARSGRCAARKGACVAATDQDCVSSYACRQHGECTAKEGECVAKPDAG
jgi:hypothetical protein